MLTTRYVVCRNPSNGALSISPVPRGMPEKDFVKSRKLKLLHKANSFKSCQQFIDNLNIVKDVLES